VEDAVHTAWNSLPQDVAKPVWETGFCRAIFGNESVGDSLKQQFNTPIAPPPVLPDVTTTMEVHKGQRILPRHKQHRTTESSVPQINIMF